MDFKKDYYQILEVSRKASKEEIKASYRKLAKRYHPDKNPGDAAVEEKFKDINEAHEVLNNDITRHVYDEYKTQIEKLELENQKGSTINKENKKTYYRTEVINKEKRIYIRGKVVVKFWGEQLEEDSVVHQREVNFKIHPTDVRVTIADTNIHPINEIPSEYQKSFKESELFKTAINQPVKCTIITATGEEHYSLELYDIRIKDPRITNVTKHDGQSLGTLEGDLYGYTLEIEEEQIQVPVTECFGPTGKIESKQEGGFTFIRKEYYYKDCSTYWASWERVLTPGPDVTRGGKRTKGGGSVVQANELKGCFQWWWLPLLILLILVFPKFFLGLLVLFAIGLVFSFLGRIFSILGRILPWLFLFLFALIVLGAIRSCSRGVSPYIKHDTPSYDTLATTINPVKMPSQTNPSDTAQREDTLINHFIRWKDYDSSMYETNLAISTADLRSSSFEHDNYSGYGINSLAPVYSYLSSVDGNKLGRIYNAFDSIRMEKNLDEIQFAKMMVTCIQSVPFYLVVDRSCNDSYDDEYVQNYLATCTKDCCIGFEKYGVRSPVEFMSDLKGDCDTRSLLLYTILKHYKYNVALLTSNYYKHAVIAVNFKNYSEDGGLAMNIHDRNYYLWETTSAGFNIGILPNDLQNLNYWDIALLNENN